MKQLVLKILKKSLKNLGIKIEDEKIIELIETPKDYSNGDFAFPCFLFSKELKKSPVEIAKEIKDEIKEVSESIEKVENAGPYVNFYVNKKKLAENLIKEISEEKDGFGNLKNNDKKILIEFPSPNTNKPLHLGHLRNMVIGESVSRISKANGFDIIRVNLNNDRGIHICKSMAAYQKYGKNEEPTKEIKGDHLVGDFYVLYNNKLKDDKNLEIEAQELLKKWESGDKETVELWKKMNKWALDGFRETYEKFGIHFNKEYFESEIYKEGKEIILDGLKKGIFKEKDGTVIADLENEKLGEKVLLRKDGTSIYITQDIYLAKLKFDEFSPDESIYVTGNEQDYHFKVLFSILEKLGLTEKEKLKHLSYGMVNLPSGRMKSREGTVVDADNLIEDLQNLVKKELEKRGDVKDVKDKSIKIALAAIKYFLLKVDIRKNMLFNPEESISFDGDTGPYLEYAYARASSILRKVKNDEKLKIPENLEEKEKELIIKINEFKKVVLDSFRQMNPALIANYSYKLAQIFNEFYHECPVINSDSESFRIELVKIFRQTLKNSLYLLGIETLEEM